MLPSQKGIFFYISRGRNFETKMLELLTLDIHRQDILIFKRVFIVHQRAFFQLGPITFETLITTRFSHQLQVIL